MLRCGPYYVELQANVLPCAAPRRITNRWSSPLQSYEAELQHLNARTQLDVRVKKTIMCSKWR